VSDYGLDDRAIGVRSPGGAKDFSSILCVQTGFEAHLASCTMGPGVLSPGAKRGRGVTVTTHPHLVPKSRMSRSYYLLSPQAPPWRVAGLYLLLFYAYMRSPSCLRVCPLSTSETIGKFYEIQYGGQAIEGDLKASSFHPVASTIPKWRRLKLLRWVQNFTSQCGAHAIS
jgi:hypothetical protein